jgi:hypothetical protein
MANACRFRLGKLKGIDDLKYQDVEGKLKKKIDLETKMTNSKGRSHRNRPF